MLGSIHQRLIDGYDFFGWGDIDVIYGDIRSIYTDQVLSRNVISTHNSICSGHLTLVRNEDWLREAYLNLSSWQTRLEDPEPFLWRDCLDEAHLSAIFSPDPRVRRRLSYVCTTKTLDPRYWSDNYFVEQWSTPFVPGPWIDGTPYHPETWLWTNGRLTNTQDGARAFLYLHLMNFKSKRWLNPLYYDTPTWDELSTTRHFSTLELVGLPWADRSFRVDRKGTHAFCRAGP